MSGLGRRTHYRKHLTDSVWNDLPQPTSNERIAKVLGTRGSNQFELIIGPETPASAVFDKTPQLAILPTKYRKLVWLKRNDYVICSCAEDDGDTEGRGDEGGIRYMIKHILYKDQVKHLKEKGFWPKDEIFSDDVNIKKETLYPDETEGHDEDCGSENGDSANCEDNEGIVFDNADDDYFCNMNRISKLKVDDSSSDEDSD
uniref:S1-like domain-containing protein n=1 Tax=Chaetoceros debilis TaxID=122233 RepID=A0A7S3PXC7_9STRA|mmetsp:Transcript_13614/g.19830  ORF Transcript_13614/g.19830 Transcript_13614/m.19830 type:complete len:201 (+) Transcript_13614:146-748(+)